MACRNCWAPAVAAMLICLAMTARAEDGNVPSTASLTSAQVVSQMEHRNAVRAEDLKRYKSVRHYEVSYKGFGARLDAKMEVEVRFDAPAGKSFRILSQSGSKLLLDKVLKRLLETEKEALGNQKATALSAANYRFEMAGMDTLGGRPAYALSVQPLTDNKLLYRGKIWVDAADFAVVKIEAEPARNPSFWISRTEIHHTYAKTGEFWLPEQNRSESKIRVGGRAVLTIDYGAYDLNPAEVPAIATK